MYVWTRMNAPMLMCFAVFSGRPTQTQSLECIGRGSVCRMLCHIHTWNVKFMSQVPSECQIHVTSTIGMSNSCHELQLRHTNKQIYH